MRIRIQLWRWMAIRIQVKRLKIGSKTNKTLTLNGNKLIFTHLLQKLHCFGYLNTGIMFFSCFFPSLFCQIWDRYGKTLISWLHPPTVLPANKLYSETACTTYYFPKLPAQHIIFQQSFVFGDKKNEPQRSEMLVAAVGPACVHFLYLLFLYISLFVLCLLACIPSPKRSCRGTRAGPKNKEITANHLKHATMERCYLHRS
jgi:hypothetical protein